MAAQPLETTTAWYAVDASVWPRCDAETSPERGYYHHHSRHSNGQPIVAGWNYSWLVQIPERCSSWTAPLAGASDAARGKRQSVWPQSRFAPSCANAEAGKPRPTFTFDAGYDPVQLGMALAGARRECPRAAAVWPVLLCGSTAGTDRRTTAAAWGQVCL